MIIFEWEMIFACAIQDWLKSRNKNIQQIEYIQGVEKKFQFEMFISHSNVV